jgi:hypothetical protein
MLRESEGAAAHSSIFSRSLALTALFLCFNMVDRAALYDQLETFTAEDLDVSVKAQPDLELY